MGSRHGKDNSTSPIATRHDRVSQNSSAVAEVTGRYDSKVCSLLPRRLAASQKTISQSRPAFLDRHLKKLLTISVYPSCAVKQPWGWDLIPVLAHNPQFASSEIDFISESEREPTRSAARGRYRCECCCYGYFREARGTLCTLKETIKKSLLRKCEFGVHGAAYSQARREEGAVSAAVPNVSASAAARVLGHTRDPELFQGALWGGVWFSTSVVSL